MKNVYTLKLESARQCPITVGEGLLERLEKHFDFSGYSSIVFITDITVQRLYGRVIAQQFKAPGRKVHIFTLPTGERAKSMSTVERGYRFLLANKVDRKGLVCALGGGVVGDTAGFIAASYLRGIDYIQLPTTLLAQVDSSIGGKVGVNFEGKKNMVGSFYQPAAIIADVSLLRSLPPAEMRHGLAEVIKYAVAMDDGLYRRLEQKEENSFSAEELKAIVTLCCHLKSAIIEADEREKTGERAILNFGHTLAHALESASDFAGSHGEAVAVGMVAAARISRRLGKLNTNDVEGIQGLLQKFELPTAACCGVSPEALVNAIRYDKKTTSGRTHWVLLEGIGRGITNQTVDAEVARKVIEELCR